MSGLTIFEPENLKSATQAAAMLAKSRMVPQHFQGKPEDVFAAIIMGHELGISPMQSLQQIVVIQGRPTMSAQLMLAIVQSKFPGAIINITLDEKALVARCEVARSKEEKDSSYLATWDMSKAQAMGLSSRDQYKKQPMNMLKWRAVTEALRVKFPDALCGLYAKEEFQDFDGEPVKTLVNIDNEEDTRDKRTPEQRDEGNPRYLICFGKYRNKELCQIAPIDLEDYLNTIEAREANGQLKDWELELKRSINLYLTNLEKQTAHI